MHRTAVRTILLSACTFAMLGGCADASSSDEEGQSGLSSRDASPTCATKSSKNGRCTTLKQSAPPPLAPRNPASQLTLDLWEMTPLGAKANMTNVYTQRSDAWFAWYSRRAPDNVCQFSVIHFDDEEPSVQIAMMFKRSKYEDLVAWVDSRELKVKRQSDDVIEGTARTQVADGTKIEVVEASWEIHRLSSKLTSGKYLPETESITVSWDPGLLSKSIKQKCDRLQTGETRLDL